MPMIVCPSLAWTQRFPVYFAQLVLPSMKSGADESHRLSVTEWTGWRLSRYPLPPLPCRRPNIQSNEDYGVLTPEQRTALKTVLHSLRTLLKVLLLLLRCVARCEEECLQQRPRALPIPVFTEDVSRVFALSLAPIALSSSKHRE